MRDAAASAGNPVRKVLDRELPGYVEWFNEDRDIRNAIKTGIPTGGGSRGALDGPPAPEVHLNAVVRERGVDTVVIAATVSVEQVDEALRQSTKVLEVIERRIRARTAKAEG
jgi:hypothetical protein